MKFQPKQESELNEFSLLENGIYPFQIMYAVDQISKNGNEMIKMTVKIFGNDGREHILFDYLLEAIGYKLRHFAEHTGLLDKYNAGEFSSSDCIGKCGKADIIVQKGQLKPDGSLYQDRNSVKDYIKSDVIQMKPLPKLENDFTDDQLPF